MKLVLSILFTISALNSALCNTDSDVDILREPILSRRCKSLLDDRKQKLSVEQRLTGMLLRNTQLTDQAAEEQKTLKRRLELNKRQIENNLRLTKMRIKSMEENIIRNGCPGIIL